MNAMKIGMVALAIGFAAGMGCGSDSGSKTDAQVISGNLDGGSTHLDASGAGGTGAIDAPIGTGGTGGSAIDASHIDSSISSIDSNSVTEAGGGEAGTTTNICTGLSAADCDLAIRNATVDTTVVAQDVPTTNTVPAYSVCSQ